MKLKLEKEEKMDIWEQLYLKAKELYDIICRKREFVYARELEVSAVSHIQQPSTLIT